MDQLTNGTKEIYSRIILNISLFLYISNDKMFSRRFRAWDNETAQNVSP